MSRPLERRPVRLEATAAAQGNLRHLTDEQLEGLIAACERRIAADAAAAAATYDRT